MSTNGILGEEKMRKTSGDLGVGSPKNKVKFLCSYGGKILPRPSDNHLKYVGGETRVVSVPHDIEFSELMKKLTSLIEGEMILKYQLLPEELDALVSVKSDEDLRHMFDECNRHSIGGTPRLRAFLFPAKPTIIENQSLEPQALEQRYIDAINGIIRSTTPPPKPTTITASYPTFSINSPCSSPRSPDSCTTDNFPPMPSTKPLMPRVRSSPSISNMSTLAQNIANNPQQAQHYHCYKPTSMAAQPSHVYHHHHQQHQHPSYLQPSKPPLDQRSNFAPEKFTKVRSIGRSTETSRFDAANVQNHYYSRQRGGIKCIQYDDYGSVYGDGRIENHSLSPLPRSPRQGYGGGKAWDSAL